MKNKNKFTMASFQIGKREETKGKPKKFLGIASFMFIILACIITTIVLIALEKISFFSLAIILMILVFLGWMTFKVAYPKTNESIIKMILKIIAPLLTLEFIYEIIGSIISMANNLNKNSVLRVIFFVAITIFFARMSIIALGNRKP
jgi:hypothetical protein